MSDIDGRFVRVFYNKLERDHPTVYYDPAALGTWLRLLVLSDKAWPAMPELPRWVRKTDLITLRTADVIEFLPNHQFVLEGWHKERQARADAARLAVSKRKDRNTDAPTSEPTTVDSPVPTSVLSIDLLAGAGASASPSVDVTRREGVQGEPAPDDWDCLDTYHSLTRFRPWGIWSGDKLKGAAREYGDEAVSAALRAESDQDPDVDTLMDRAFARLAKAADRAKSAKPKRPQLLKPKVDEKARNALILEMQGRTSA